MILAKAAKYVLKVLEVCQTAFKTMGESINKGVVKFVGDSDKMTEEEFKQALRKKKGM